MFGNYVGQCPNKKRGKQEKEEQVAATAVIENYTVKFKKEFSLVTVVSSCNSSRPMDVGKWIVESAYCEYMIVMRDAFLTIETIPKQLTQDGEGTMYAVRGVERV